MVLIKMGWRGQHPCSNSIQGNGFTQDDFWVMAFLKPIAFSGSFSEHSSSMTRGWNVEGNSPSVYRRQKKQDLLRQQRAGADVWMQMGSRCRQLVRTAAHLKGTCLWPPPSLTYCFYIFLFIWYVRSFNYEFSLCHYVLEVPPFPFASLSQLHLCSPIRLPRARLHPWEWDRGHPHEKPISFSDRDEFPSNQCTWFQRRGRGISIKIKCGVKGD